MSSHSHARDDSHTYPLNTLDKDAIPVAASAVATLEHEDRQDKIEDASAGTREASPDAETVPPVYRLYKRR